MRSFTWCGISVSISTDSSIFELLLFLDLELNIQISEISITKSGTQAVTNTSVLRHGGTPAHKPMNIWSESNTKLGQRESHMRQLPRLEIETTRCNSPQDIRRQGDNPRRREATAIGVRQMRIERQ
uniref:Uncharacterized protein n=1 Tax=Opuntia streptacantha TaxID=393608 RepID=A0A7C8ZWH6_OPUST